MCSQRRVPCSSTWSRRMPAVSSGRFQKPTISCGAERMISPTSPAGITRVPSSPSKMRTWTSGSGMPTEPILFGPFTGLMQQPSSLRSANSPRRCARRSSTRTAVLVSAMSGAAPEKQILIDLKSTLPCCTSGWLSSAMYSVGTPLKNAGLTWRIVFEKIGEVARIGHDATAGCRLTSASAWTPTLA